jgi:hypothetical protein
MTPARTIQERMDDAPSFCDPECEGRCRECPDDLIKDLWLEITRLRTSEETRERCAKIADEFAAIYCAPAGSGYSYGYATGKKEAGMSIAKAIRALEINPNE